MARRCIRCGHIETHPLIWCDKCGGKTVPISQKEYEKCLDKLFPPKNGKKQVIIR